MPATIELAAITVDCADPAPMANFYIAAADGELVREDVDSAWVKIAGTLWIFRRVEDYVAPSWPSRAVPQQMHVEYCVDDIVAAEEKLTAFGATTAEYQPNRTGGLVVMLDPAGHPFCIGSRG